MVVIATKSVLVDSEFEDLLSKTQGKYKNFYRAIDSLKYSRNFMKALSCLFKP